MRDVLRPETDLSTDALFERVLEDLRVDDDDRLGAIVALHERPTRQVLDRSLLLCSSSDPYERTVGLRVLRELDHPLIDRERLWLSAEPTVLRLASTDENPEVVKWAISCLGYQATSGDALEAVLNHVDHHDERVRFAVAAALPSVVDRDDPDQRAVDALFELAEDSDGNVRSYAIMGLADDLGLAGSMRPTLHAHLTDPDDQIRRYCEETLAET